MKQVQIGATGTGTEEIRQAPIQGATLAGDRSSVCMPRDGLFRLTSWGVPRWKYNIRAKWKSPERPVILLGYFQCDATMANDSDAPSSLELARPYHAF